jgi:hypothetical protein
VSVQKIVNSRKNVDFVIEAVVVFPEIADDRGNVREVRIKLPVEVIYMAS